MTFKLNMNRYYVYILTNTKNSVLYIGVTNNLERRILEHRQKLTDGFTKKYNVTKLVYFEECSRIDDALRREKQLKNWHREWKVNLIRTVNPNLKELYSEILQEDNFCKYRSSE